MDTISKLDEISHKLKETVMKTIAIKKSFKTLKKKTRKANESLRKKRIK